MPTMHQRWDRLKEFAKTVWGRYVNDRVPLVAAGVAFYLTLAMIPLLLLVVTVATFFISQEQIQSFGTDITEVLGPGIGEAIRSQVLSVVRNRGVLTGISLLIGLWASSQVFVIIMSALDQTWDVEDRRPFWVRRGISLLMVFVAGGLVTIAVLLNIIIRLIGQANE